MRRETTSRATHPGRGMLGSRADQSGEVLDQGVAGGISGASRSHSSSVSTSSATRRSLPPGDHP